MVVRPGVVIEAISILSKPTTPRSSGILRLNLFAALRTAAAKTSALQKMASGGVAEFVGDVGEGDLPRPRDGDGMAFQCGLESAEAFLCVVVKHGAVDERDAFVAHVEDVFHGALGGGEIVYADVRGDRGAVVFTALDERDLFEDAVGDALFELGAQADDASRVRHADDFQELVEVGGRDCVLVYDDLETV